VLHARRTGIYELAIDAVGAAVLLELYAEIRGVRRILLRFTESRRVLAS
jgi:hypothetical protein